MRLHNGVLARVSNTGARERSETISWGLELSSASSQPTLTTIVNVRIYLLTNNNITYNIIIIYNIKRQLCYCDTLSGSSDGSSYLGHYKNYHTD